ncbi:glycerate kinase [Actinospica acidithermotolerans]|uniref:glycerate kinase n=1 Tax=Actinospica acidithermotolerans TaxID=2828514 RepID=UPI0027DBFD4E|nr:glycerate kinase [Actinospica acidithermotolerans]
MTEGWIVIAPDKFKGSLSAAEVADAVAAGLSAAGAAVGLRTIPIADGGDGTVDAAVSAGFQRATVTVRGPLGEPVEAAYAVSNHTAVVELAEASGLRRLPPGVFDSLHSSTYGTGEVIRAALDAGARTLILGVGGSASTDGGTGMLAALGARFLDSAGDELEGCGAALTELASVDLSGLDERIAQTEVILATDVDNPLLGTFGAAAVYGPQKGAAPDDVLTLETGLGRLVDVLTKQLGEHAVAAAAQPGAGAAGGVGYGAVVGLGATVRPGIELMLELLGVEQAMRGASLVVTGEGSLDEQSLRGKAPVGVARLAALHGVPVVAVCGRLRLTRDQLRQAGIREAFALAEIEPDPARSMADARRLLGEIAPRLLEAVGLG